MRRGCSRDSQSCGFSGQVIRGETTFSESDNRMTPENAIETTDACADRGFGETGGQEGLPLLDARHREYYSSGNKPPPDALPTSSRRIP